MMKIIITSILLSLLTFSCTLIKNPHSANFHRVKYNAHLKSSKLKKESVAKTVDSFDNKNADFKKNELIKTAELNKRNDFTLTAHYQKVTSQSEKPIKELNPIVLNQVRNILSDVATIQPLNYDLTHSRTDYWWENDPEDWPWGEIVLAVIAILLIAILIVILIELIGAIIGSLFGLILLIALAYLLYVYWV